MIWRLPRLDNLLGVLGVASGGTGATTATQARANLGLGSAATSDTSDFDAAGAAGTVSTALSSHTSSMSNPHAVTKSQVGLGNVLNSIQLVAASNLSDLASATAARTNLGLGSIATQAVPNGLAKGNGTTLSAATAGTDYLAPAGSGASLTGITYTQVGGFATGKLAGRSTAGTGAIEAITVSTGLNLSGGTLACTVTATSPGGSSGQLQYNSAGAFAGAASSSVDGSGNLTALSYKTLGGFYLGDYYLQRVGSGAAVSMGAAGGAAVSVISPSATAYATMLYVSPTVSTAIGATIKANASQSASLQEWQDSSGNIYSSITKAGYISTQKHSAPADGDLVAGQLALWFDQTPGSAKLQIKAKDSAGTVVSGSVALS